MLSSYWSHIKALEAQDSQYVFINMYIIYIYLSPNHQDTFDLKKAQEILDRDHYGLADIKVPRWVNPMGSHGMIWGME